MSERLTPFGRKCREFRARYNFVMADQAKGLGISVAYISAIELGKREIPSEYTAHLSHWMSLPDEDSKLLEELAINHARATVRLKPRNAEQAKLAKELAENFGHLPKEGLEYLRVSLAVSRSVSNSYLEIRKRALLASALFNLNQELTFDVLKIVENQLHLVDPDFFLKVETDRTGQPPLHSDSDGKKVRYIASSQWFYSEASQQTAASRFTLAHEIAHWILHPQSSLAYSRSSRTNHIISKRYLKAESEADVFAREFLLPITVMDRFESPEALAKATNVPVWAARKRFRELREMGAQERSALREFAKATLNRVVHLRPQVGQDVKLSKSTVTSIQNIEPLKRPSTRRRHRTAVRPMDLFEYADLKQNGQVRSDEWFRRYGYRG